MSGSRDRRSRDLGIACLLLAGVTALFEFTNFDLALQDKFYNPATGRWLVDVDEPVGRAIFYNGPKIFVWVVGVTLLTLVAGPARWREKLRFERRGLWLALLVLISTLAAAGAGKEYANVFCPSETRRYGGQVAYAKLCEPFPAGDRPARRGKCFPAGHASGGFALMGLLALRSSRRWRRGAVWLGLGLGWWMGLYQMLKGAHYLSHTLTTLLLAWIAVLVWQRVLQIAPAE